MLPVIALNVFFVFYVTLSLCMPQVLIALPNWHILIDTKPYGTTGLKEYHKQENKIQVR